MSDRSDSGEAEPTTLQRALRDCRRQFMGVGLFSLVVNLLTLTTALYMMQLFDRVLASRSMDTLAYLSLVVVLALVFQGILEAIRALVLSRTAAWVERVVGPEALARALEVRLRGTGYAMESLRDLATCRAFLGSPAMLSIFDLPWVPIYLAVAFLFHPLIGCLAVVAAVLLLALTVATARLTDGHFRRANSAAMNLQRRTDALSRNAEVIDSMGMASAILGRWQTDVDRIALDQQRATDRAGIMLAVTKLMRVLVQVACLGAGAWLALQNEITGGAMVAASILLGRALAPVEQMIGAWKQFASARQSYRRLAQHLSQAPLRSGGTNLPDPEGRLTVERVSYGFPGSRVSMIKGVDFALEPGEAMAMLGPSAAGKTTLVRLLIGTVEPTIGTVRLDGANLFTWSRDDVGRHIGYLPQDVELFEGTVFANIARFQEAEPRAVIAAARLAGAHDMILRLPKGYETEIGEVGALLSGGQRQLLGVARALFGNPRLLVLDEPNANMDTEGELALLRALDNVKALGTTVIMVTHRPSLVQAVDKVLILRDGVAEAFGPRDEIMRQLIKPVPRGGPAAAGVNVSRSLLRATGGGN